MVSLNLRACNMVMWYWSVDTMFWQVSIYHNMDVQYQRRTLWSSYYTASSASGQDEPNRALWLATRAARWSRLARSRLPAVSSMKNFPESHIINPLLTKFVRSRWLDIGLVRFLRVYVPRLRLGPLTRKKGLYGRILTELVSTEHSEYVILSIYISY